MSARNDLPKRKKSQYFFREWRDYRGLSQEELAHRIGQTAPSISQLENGKQGFRDVTLLAIAAALDCHPAELLARDPFDRDSVWSIWESIAEEDRPAALRAISGFVRKPIK